MSIDQLSAKAQQKKKLKANNFKRSFSSGLGDLPTIKEDSQEISEIKNAIEENDILHWDFRRIDTNSNIRRNVDTKSKEFLQLMQSIRENGILQNLVCEFVQENHERFKLICVAGHRRLAALNLLLSEQGLNETQLEVPIQVINRDIGQRRQIKSIALSENVHRKKLHYIEVADTYAEIKKVEGLSVDQIANKFEKNNRTIGHYLKIAAWPEEAKNLIFSYPDLFSLKYVWANYVMKPKAHGVLIRQIKSRIKKFETDSADSSEKKISKISAKENRIKKLNSYFKDFNITQTDQEKINHAFQHLGLT